MSYEIPGQVIPLPASADLSAAQFLFVAMSATGIALAGAGDYAVGVLQDKPDALGRPGAVMVNGVTKVVAGAAVAVNAIVTSDAAGKAVTAGTTADEGMGIALEAAANADEIIAVLLMPFGWRP
jgi:hypothetical protein